MAVYVMGDIHGCFDEFQHMLNIIGFSDEDRLILTGDYIDRGEQNISMLRWLAKKPENVVAIKGNHDVEFCGHIDLMKIVDHTAELETDYDSPSDTLFLYQTVEYALKKSDASDSIYFDYYKTIQGMAESGQITFREMLEWRDMLEKLPYTFSLPIEDKICVVVHAGYCESDELTGEHFNNQEEFFIFACGEEFQPTNQFLMGGNKIAVGSLNHNLPFGEIQRQLEDIVKEYFAVHKHPFTPSA